MNRKLLILVVLLLAVAGLFVWRSMRADAPELWLGYVEGEALYIAAPVSGTLGARAVERGGTVKAGEALFTLNPVSSDADVARLEAEVTAARAQMSDLEQGRSRAPELAVSRANIAAAKAQATKAQKDFERIAAIAARGFVSKSQLDAARAARDVANAQVAQTVAQEQSGRLTAGRQDQVRAAAAQVSAAESALAAQRQRRSEIAPLAPASGVVEQTFFNPGEWVPANSPILSILPDDRRKIRFFVPQDRVAGVRSGQVVRFTCDGCKGEQTAIVRYIAPRAEFTPPVIYSEGARAKLVFMVEAALAATSAPLPPGLPVDVKAVEFVR